MESSQRQKQRLADLRHNHSYTSSEQSSSYNSLHELGQADERGLRTSFREQPFVHLDDEVTDNEATNKVKVKHVQVYTIPGDRTFHTPDETASSGVRSLFSNGGIRNIDMSSVQQKYSNRFGLAKSQRTEIRHQEEKEADYETTENKYDSFFQDEIESWDSEKKISCLPKLAALGLTVLIFVAGLVLLIYFKKETAPEGHRGTIIVETEEEPDEPLEIAICPELIVNLRGVIRFNCSLPLDNGEIQLLQYVKVTPPTYQYQGETFVIYIYREEQSTAWSAFPDVYHNDYILRVRGPEATCSSGGTYYLQFMNHNNESKINTNVQISVKSEVLRVNVSLTQDNGGNNTDFRLGCSTNSGCEQSFVDFFAEINKEEQYLRGVNFSCVIDYNDYDGYSVSCVGNIPDYLMSQFERITCRPRSSILDDLDAEELEAEIELPDCDLTKHCGYECKEEGDYYVVSKERCDIFHRCYQEDVFTSYCAPGTFFDPGECACRHTRELSWCQQNGVLKPGSDVSDMKC